MKNKPKKGTSSLVRTSVCSGIAKEYKDMLTLVLWARLKGLSHKILKSFLSSTILNQYFLYGR
jgi:hypothetical protein